MKLKQLYELIIEAGMASDPRGLAHVKTLLHDEKKKYEKIEAKEKDVYDKDRLLNPYADTRILYGNPGLEIRSIMVGIDMEVGEMVLVDRLREKGMNIDCVIGHHPDGHALARFYDVMSLQIDLFSKRGVPVTVAEKLTKERMHEVSRSVSSANHMQTVDAARLLDIPLMCAHTPADNHVSAYVQKIVDIKKPKRLKDILELLNAEPEYKEAARNNAAPFIINGNPESQAGKVFVDMTGGTEGSKEIFSRLVHSGVSTLMCMHLSESHVKNARAEKMNVVNAGHIASDNLGLNLLLDKVIKKEKVTIIEASGFRRFKRK